MTTVLRVLAVACVFWSVAYLGAPDFFLPGSRDQAALRFAIHALVAGEAVLAFLFLRASTHPQQHLPVLAGAGALLVARSANDLYGVLNLPPSVALAALVDLVVSVALFVALLRALPGTLEVARRQPQSSP